MTEIEVKIRIVYCENITKQFLALWAQQEVGHHKKDLMN